MPIPLVVALALPTGPAIFDQSVAAFRARKSFAVTVGLDATLNKTVTSARYKLSYVAPNQVLLIKLVDGRPNLTFWLSGSKFIAYDPEVREMVVRKATTTGQVVDRVANAVGQLEDPLTAQLSPDNMAAFLYRFRAVQGWHTKTTGNRIAMTRNAVVRGNKTFTELDFDARSKLLTRANLVGPGSKLLWSFTYGPAPRILTFRPPAGTKTVSSLSEHLRIDASDAKARAIVDQSLRDYSRLTSISYSVTSQDGTSENMMDGTSFWERQSRYEWAYRSGYFTLRDRATGKVFKGKCRRNAVLNYLKILKSPMDPVLQALLGQRNPIRGWFLPGMKVSSRGSVVLNGIKATAIELRSAELEVSMLIRTDNSLIASVSTRSKDASGRTVYESEREFTYRSVNKQLPAAAFEIKSQKYLPLSSIGK
jgi:hypothetical protein